MDSLEAIDRLVERISRPLTGRGPFSLCEAGFTPEEYEELQRFLRENVTRQTLRLTGWKAGIVLLLFAAETARRNAREGDVWQAVYRRLPDELRKYLFVPGQQPGPQFKELVEGAIRLMHLRHALDLEDSQKWYLTVYLQFGFTRQGMVDQLPHLLAGQNLSRAVQILLYSPDQASQTFWYLWQALKHFRRDRITDSRTRQVIRQSPWVLSAWEANLMQACRDKLHLVDEQDEEDEEEDLPLIIEAPHWRWLRGERPEAICSLEELHGFLPGTEAPLLAPHYDLDVGGDVLARFIRQCNGRYVPAPDQVVLTPSSARVRVTLSDPDGNALAARVVELWDPAEDFFIIDLTTGAPLLESTPWQPTHVHQFLIITAADLHVVHGGDSLLWAPLGEGRRATRLSGTQLREVEIHDANGRCVWKPPLAEHPADHSGPLWAKSVGVDLVGHQESVSLGSVVRLQLRGLNGRKLLYVRANGEPVDFDVETSTAGPVRLSADFVRSGCRFVFGVEDGRGACPCPAA